MYSETWCTSNAKLLIFNVEEQIQVTDSLPLFGNTVCQPLKKKTTKKPPTLLYIRIGFLENKKISLKFGLLSQILSQSHWSD